MSPAKLSPQAVRDLQGHCDYISADNPDAATRVRHTILHTADFLAQHREIGRRILKADPHYAQIRWFVVPRFRNFLIFYQPWEDTIMVVRILRSAQDWTRYFPTSADLPPEA